MQINTTVPPADLFVFEYKNVWDWGIPFNEKVK
jgi:hypothetical protein